MDSKDRYRALHQFLVEAKSPEHDPSKQVMFLAQATMILIEWMDKLRAIAGKQTDMAEALLASIVRYNDRIADNGVEIADLKSRIEKLENPDRPDGG